MGSIDTRAGEIASECCIRVCGCKPERIADARLGGRVATEQIDLVLVILRDESLRAGRRHDGWKLASTALELQCVIVVIVLKAHAQADVRVAKGLQGIDRENIARLINVAE